MAGRKRAHKEEDKSKTESQKLQEISQKDLELLRSAIGRIEERFETARTLLESVTEHFELDAWGEQQVQVTAKGHFVQASVLPELADLLEEVKTFLEEIEDENRFR